MPNSSEIEVVRGGTATFRLPVTVRLLRADLAAILFNHAAVLFDLERVGQAVAATLREQLVLETDVASFEPKLLAAAGVADVLKALRALTRLRDEIEDGSQVSDPRLVDLFEVLELHEQLLARRGIDMVEHAKLRVLPVKSKWRGQPRGRLARALELWVIDHYAAVLGRVAEYARGIVVKTKGNADKARERSRYARLARSSSRVRAELELAVEGLWPKSVARPGCR